MTYTSGRPAYALVDCNSMYASVEVLFRPWLRDQAVVVLSANDGNAIARNRPAKALGIKMGQPYHEIAHLHRQGQVHVFSSNFGLYQEISNRVMAVLRRLASRIEVYSIDEAWLDVTGLGDNLTDWGRSIQETVLREVGMPTGVGIGWSKTQAKINAGAAKAYPERTGGVLDVREPERFSRLLARTSVSDVWGIGPRLSRRLAHDLEVITALDLARANRRLLQRYYGSPIERTARELAGEASFCFGESPAPRRMIACGRAFGSKVFRLQELDAAVATYAGRVMAKAREQGSLVQCFQIYVRTSSFSPGTPYSAQEVVVLPYPTDDTREVISAARVALRRIYREGPAYAKAGVVLTQLLQADSHTPDLFAGAPRQGSVETMKVMDAINAKMGRGSLRVAREQASSGWEMRRQFLGPSFTTRWSDLPVAR